GLSGTADDVVVSLAAGGQAVVYDPSTNVNVASGLTYPTAVRQTVTLLFDPPLPSGAYRVEVFSGVPAVPFNADEPGRFDGMAGHPVVSAVGGLVVEGSQLLRPALVTAAGPLGDFGVWKAGTPFLTQLHDNLGALLDAALTQRSDDPDIP